MKTQLRALALLACAMILASCRSSKKSHEYRMRVLHEQKNGSTVDIEYPDFYAYPEINHVVGSYIASKYEEAQKRFAQNPSDGGTENELDIGCTEISVTESNIAIIISVYECRRSDARGNTEYRSFNYDTETGRFIDITDVPGLDMKKLSDSCIRNLKKQLYGSADIADKKIEEGASPEPRNFSTFCYDGFSLSVYFQQEQVAPYSKGILCVDLTAEDFAIQ